MELIDYVRMLGRRWTWWVSFLILGILAGVGYAHTATKIYSATTESFVASVATGPTGNTSGALKDARDNILGSMASYSALVDSPAVVQGAIEDLDLTLTQQQVARHLSAVHIPRTVVLRVTATSTSPSEAVELSAAASKRLGIAIQNLETSAPGASPPVKVIVVRPARVPSTPTSPNRTLAVALGLLAGLGLGLLTASLRDQALRTAPEPPMPPAEVASTHPGRNRDHEYPELPQPAPGVP